MKLNFFPQKPAKVEVVVHLHADANGLNEEQIELGGLR